MTSRLRSLPFIPILSLLQLPVIPGHNVEHVIIENVHITFPLRSSKGQAYIPLDRLNQVHEKAKNYPEYSMFRELHSWGLYVRHAKGIQMKNVTFQLIDDEFRPAIIFDDVKGINITKIKLPENLMSNQLVLKDFNDFKIDYQSEGLVRIIE